MKPYSKDLRLKVLAACDRGMPREEVSRIFGVYRADHQALREAAQGDR